MDNSRSRKGSSLVSMVWQNDHLGWWLSLVALGQEGLGYAAIRLYGPLCGPVDSDMYFCFAMFAAGVVFIFAEITTIPLSALISLVHISAHAATSRRIDSLQAVALMIDLAVIAFVIYGYRLLYVH